MRRAMVVLSGGQDSTTCLFWARQHFDEVHAVTFDYGQRHKVEVESATHVAAMAQVHSQQVVSVAGVLQSRSPLVDAGAELETYTDFSSMDRIIGDRVELTFVPMRNAFFLTIAANIALAQNCFDLVTGVCQSDNANYPDCRQSFIDAQQALINTALGISGFTIHAPLMNLDKAAIVQLARSIEGAWDALAWSHTCYAGTVPPCGECHACVLRAHGFAQANEVDPLITRTAP
jgi:7-cyano-7-deazaguanine synthase